MSKIEIYSFGPTAQANNVKNLETPEDKLGWMFDAFDADGGGTVDRYIYIYLSYLHRSISVDRDEITDIVVGLFRLGGIEEDQVSCDWWIFCHVTADLISGWSRTSWPPACSTSWRPWTRRATARSPKTSSL